MPPVWRWRSRRRFEARQRFMHEVRALGDFRSDLFTRTVEQWFEWVAPLATQPRVIAVEIGSYEGLSACFMLNYVFARAVGEMICIDPFAPSDPEHPAFEEDYESRFDANTAFFDHHGLVRKLRGRSHPKLLQLLDEGYGGCVDFLYVDGSHDGLDTVIDGALAWKLLTPGGLVVFDDYDWNPEKPRSQKPKAAIDAFLSIVRDESRMVHRGYQVAIRKR